ncbi:isocitrate/isopropylmalate family dehydrogenase [Bosea sp. TND4EK4]|uniref:isocitrate/isopropylmalate family dehydrogenase n=1 Tax=Bosea sp. TND4EK4 TaxID=1907408 RepID=UPI0009551080|nr:isocitrate/isopropylmalate family dehydrogenase [Bosea sp. TND4EK4]SIP88280.1 tartrate dehydrogenase/decarboxylase / D-malate dehydrogenase [Bosea sp. TND4EK4]
MRTHRLLAIGHDTDGGDGLLTACIAVLEASTQRAGTFQLDIARRDDRTPIDRPGSAAPSDFLESVGSADAVLLVTGEHGATDDQPFAAVRKTIVACLDLAVTVCPIRTLNGLHSPLLDISPPPFDWLIVGGIDAATDPGHGEHTPSASDIGPVRDHRISRQPDIERVLRHAFQTARSRLRKRLTVVTEAYPLRHDMAIWRETAEHVAQGYPDVVVDYAPVPALGERMTHHPQTLDTIATSSLHTDALSAWAAALAGPPGAFASASLNLKGRIPALFEPLQSSASGPAIEAARLPIGAFWACAMLFNHLGERDSAALLMQAIEALSSDRVVRFPIRGGDGLLEAATEFVVSSIRNQAG